MAFSRDLIVSLLEQEGLASKHGVLAVNPSTFNIDDPDGMGLHLAMCNTDMPDILLATMFLAKKHDVDKKSQDAWSKIDGFLKTSSGTISPELEKEIKGVMEQARIEIMSRQPEFIKFKEGNRTLDDAAILIQNLFESLSNVCSLLLSLKVGE